jgi:alkanesulfonate monooxygenase SsuD/methylene tetrahydromethanopterin reductase-like flavin-dependent oxidoreductase (luciferase family)
MDELIEAVLACWGPDPVSYDGEFFTIPLSDVRPKPVQQPHPPLLSGLWSQAGLRRTLAHFDIWNPARGTPAELRTRIDELNKERADDRGPLRLFFRSFAQRPGQPAGDGVPGLDGVIADVRAAVEADVEEVIVDCNFWTDIDSPHAWAEIPERLLPALRAASQA